MASKIVVFVLVVTVYQVQSKTIYYSNPQSSSTSSASSNSKASAGASSPSTNSQASSNQLSSTGPVLFPSQPSNSNQGIKASPQLQIIPGQGCNLQAIPVTQLRAPVQQTPRNQNFYCSIPRPVSQACPSSTSPQTSPAQLIQPSLTGPASVITAPVSSITIPPTGVTTIIDNSLSNSLANALQMMIANDFINSAMNNNIIKEGVQIPVVETVVPTFDLATFLQGLNAQQVQGPNTNECDSTAQNDRPSQYDWTAIQNFLNQQGQAEKPVTEATPTTDSSNLSCLLPYGPTAEQISQAANSQNTSPQPASYIPCGPQQTDNQNGQVYPTDQVGYNSAMETLAAYFGCNVSDISPVYPSVPQIVLPEEIPAQLVCNYGYMPTTVPVVSFSVQPVGGDGNNFIVGCQC